MSKEMTNLLTPQEVLQALIDGQDIEFIEQDSDEWFAFNERFAIKYLYKENLSFRKAKKQEMMTIGDVNFPKPYQGEMEYGRTYYVPSASNENLYSALEWEDDLTDCRYLSSGMLHLSKANAIAHAKALIRLSGGNHE